MSNHSVYHRWSTQNAALLLLLSDELMTKMGVSIWGAMHSYPVDRWALSGGKCPGFLAPRAADKLAPSRRSLAGWIRARIGRLCAGVRRRHPDTIRKASLMAGSMRRVWALRHQTGEQYSAVKWTRYKVAVRNVVAPAPQQDPASHFKGASRDVNYLRSDSGCRRHVADLSKGIPR